MTTYWKTTSKNQKTIVYVLTADRTVERNSDRERSATAEVKLKEAHACLSREAIGNYARRRGLSMTKALQQIEAIPPGLREVGWLFEYATTHHPFSISATVYEDSLERIVQSNPAQESRNVEQT